MKKSRTVAPSLQAAIAGCISALWLIDAAPAVAARFERALILEATAPGVWRAEARRMTVEFRRTGTKTDPRLTIRFLDANGEAVTPPNAQRITLSASGPPVAFALNGREWTSTSAQSAPRDGAWLSIVEDDHQHDFRLNVHDAAPSEAAR